jgi:hypothetical protein
MGEKHGTKLGRCAAVLVYDLRAGKNRPGQQCREKAIVKRDGNPACWVHKNAAREVEFLTGFIYER